MTETAKSVPAVYAAINNVQAVLSKEGISKGRKNSQQGYQFRGIDDIYNVVSAVVAENKLSILPRVLSREIQERVTKMGGLSFYVTVKVDFDIVCSIDASIHTISTFGEAMDTADKATNKAMSAAMKYACLIAFMIPTEGDNDADASHIDVLPKDAAKPKPTQAAKAPPADTKKKLPPVGISKEKLESLVIDATAALNDCQDMAQLKNTFQKLSVPVKEKVEGLKNQIKARLQGVPAEIASAFPGAHAEGDV